MKHGSKKKTSKNMKANAKLANELLRPNSKASSAHYDHVELWVTRILIEFKNKLYDPWVDNRKIWLSVAGFTEQEISADDDQKFMDKLETRLKSLQGKKLNREGVLFTNVGYLSEILRLTEIEREIFIFIAIATRNLYLRKAISDILIDIKEFAIQLLACVLGMTEELVRGACHNKSTLVETGFLFNKSDSWRVNAVVSWLTLEDNIAHIMFTEHDGLNNFANSFFRLTDTGNLTVADYPHLEMELRIVSGYIRNAIESRLKGVNVLIYGSPGTGKTELAKLLAASLEVPLYEVSSDICDDGHYHSDSGMRISSYKLCQSFLAKSHTGIVLFDEMEDVFPSEGTAFGGKRQQFSPTKARTNIMLESNAVPTIWLSNDVTYIDKAYLRRFDFTIELPTPPRSARKTIINRYMGELDLPAEYLERLAEHENLSPAQIERGAKVARHCGIKNPDDLVKALDLVMRNTMNLMGQTDERGRSKVASEFDLEFLNVNVDLEGLTSGLKRHPNGRICLYGPPGTGKTSFGMYLAKRLDKPLMVKRASDILDMYVGGTEQNIAKMFRAATQEGAVLMIDEADSFLQERKEAHRNWEITQVNELLTQMEAYEGILVCSTNLMKNMDQASLRRFDFKIYFDYLNKLQRWRLFVKHLQSFGAGLSTIAREKFVLDRLESLTPGDFAVARRQFAVLHKKPTPMEFSAILEQECKSKPGVPKTIGFI